MKTFIRLSVILMVLSSTILIAQNDLNGWGKSSNYNRKYNPKTFTEIKGEITKIEQFVHVRGMAPGIQIMVKTGTDTVSVHLGPKWFMDKQNGQFKLVTGDKVEVKGSKVTIRRKPIIMAREITKGGNTLQLRDEKGFPEWAGNGRS